MQLRIGSIVIHCHQFDRMVDFWQKALGYLPREPASNGWCVLRDPSGKYPNVSFQARETQRPGRNWIHLDLYTDSQTTEVARLEALGARRYPWRGGDDWRTARSRPCPRPGYLTNANYTAAPAV